MEVSFGTFQPGFYSRLSKVYLPLLFIGVTGIFVPNLLKSQIAHATPVSNITRVTYSGSYNSGNGSSGSASAAYTTPLSCSPDKGFQPAGLIANDGQKGLIQQFDQPYTHLMYGDTANQLANLSRQCPLIVPGDNEPYINAYSSYWIGWRYDYLTDQDGKCSLSNPTVLLHIKQALPGWANYDAASNQLKSQWQAYEAAVTSHENGHVKLVQQSAAQLLQAMQNLPSMDCSQVEKAVNQLGQNYLDQLGLANQNYDQQTGHGATQGAIVP